MNRQELGQAWNDCWELIAMMPIEEFYKGRIKKEFSELQIESINQCDNLRREIIKDLEDLPMIAVVWDSDKELHLQEGIEMGKMSSGITFRPDITTLIYKYKCMLSVTTPKQRRAKK